MVTEKQFREAMQYSSLSDETLSLGGYTVEIQQDQDCENPYESDEGMSPAIWISAHRHSEFKEYGAADLGAFFWNVKPDWVSRHWRAIAAILGDSETTHDEEARLRARDYGQHLSNARQELFAETLSDMRSTSWGYAVDYLDALRALYRLAGMHADTFQRNGYSQGDSVYGLIVMTPEWRELVGCNPVDAAAADKDMRAQADEFGAWAFGDCYGYTITHDATGEDLDSCWGFIGTEPDTSGLMESALDAISYDIFARQKAKQDVVKTWIKNRVPLLNRAALLADMRA